MKKLFIALLALVPSLLLTAQSDPITSAKKDTKWVTLNDPVVQIDFPADWTLDQSGMMGTKFIIFSPNDSQGDAFKENVNLQVTDLGAAGVISLEQFANAAEAQIRKFITDANIIRKERLPKGAGGDACYEIEFTGKQGELTLHWRQQYRIRGRYAYIVTFTAHTASYQAYSGLADQILGTFQIQ